MLRKICWVVARSVPTTRKKMFLSVPDESLRQLRAYFRQFIVIYLFISLFIAPFFFLKKLDVAEHKVSAVQHL